MNQIPFIQIAEALNLDKDIIQWFFFILTAVGLIVPLITLFEKMGIINWISKWIAPKIDYEKELIAIDLLRKYNTKIQKKSDHPYYKIAHEQEEFTLLNQFYNSRLEDIYLLRFCITRKERKRAFRLSRNTIFPLFVKKDLSSDSYILRKYVFKPIIYFCLLFWASIYALTAFGLLYIIFKFGHQLTLIQVLIIYFMAGIMPVVFGWMLGFLLVPYHAKLFVELERYDL